MDYEEIYLLQSLRRTSPQRLTEIATMLNIPMFSASRLVGRLAKNSLVSKEKGTKDKRSLSVRLLPAGEKMVKAIEKESYELIVENSKDMTKAELDSLYSMAETVYKVLGLPKHVIK